jgi:hypothetical protein
MCEYLPNLFMHCYFPLYSPSTFPIWYNLPRRNEERQCGGLSFQKATRIIRKAPCVYQLTDVGRRDVGRWICLCELIEATRIFRKAPCVYQLTDVGRRDVGRLICLCELIGVHRKKGTLCRPWSNSVFTLNQPPREYWMIYRGPGFLAVVRIGSSPTPSPFLPSESSTDDT